MIGPLLHRGFEFKLILAWQSRYSTFNLPRYASGAYVESGVGDIGGVVVHRVRVGVGIRSLYSMEFLHLGLWYFLKGINWVIDGPLKFWMFRVGCFTCCLYVAHERPSWWWKSLL